MSFLIVLIQILDILLFSKKQKYLFLFVMKSVATRKKKFKIIIEYQLGTHILIDLMELGNIIRLKIET